VQFRLVADFVVDGSALPDVDANGDLEEAETRLLHVIVSNPEAFNRICRLALPRDLYTDDGIFEGKFSGPEWKDIFEAVFPYLPPEDQAYWLDVRHNSVDALDSSMDRIFIELKSSLERVMLQDTSTGEEIPCWASSRLQRSQA
jgi:hypothetical protein